MIILTNPGTADLISVTTSAATTLDIHASWVDLLADGSGDPAPGRTNTAMTTATTTTVVAGPASTFVRNVKELHIRNKHVTLAGDVTVNFNQGGTLYELHKVRLAAGEAVEYIEGIGWFLIGNLLPNLRNQSTADQALAAGTDTYLTGSALAIPPNRPITVGTRLYWRLAGTKTAAGTAAWAVNVRFGTAGTTADTARLTFTHGQVGTAAIDTGTWEVRTIVRGPIGASCIVTGVMEFQHRNDVTGFSILRTDALTVTSAAFDITTTGMIVGISYAPGASSVVTFQVVAAECENI